VSEVAIGESKEEGKRKTKTPGILINNIDQELGVIKIWDEKKNRFRDVMPSRDTMATIRMYLNERRKEDARLFPFSVKTAERKIQLWTKKLLGFVRSWHSLRTTYITRCAELGQSLKIVQENTGDSIRTLLTYYTKLSPDTRRKMTQALPVIPQEDISGTMVEKEDGSP
jgi:integrase